MSLLHPQNLNKNLSSSPFPLQPLVNSLQNTSDKSSSNRNAHPVRLQIGRQALKLLLALVQISWKLCLKCHYCLLDSATAAIFSNNNGFRFREILSGGEALAKLTKLSLKPSHLTWFDSVLIWCQIQDSLDPDHLAKVLGDST